MPTGTSPSYWGNFSDREQPTLNGVVDYFNEARILLQDTVAPYRYDDPSLLSSINLTLLETRRMRPDLFVYNEYNGQAQSFIVNDNTYVDIPPAFRLALLHGLCGHALERDQEDVQDRRSTVFLGMFTEGMVGHGLGPVEGGSPPPGRRGP